MRPTAYSFSSKSTDRGEEVHPVPGAGGATVTATRTVVSPYLTMALALASSATLPTSMVRGTAAQVHGPTLELGEFLVLDDG